MKIAILGSTGMLGNAVTKYFMEAYGENNVIPTYRNAVGTNFKNAKSYDPLYRDNISAGPLPSCDVVINCIGIIKPFMKNNVLQAVLLNSVFPRKLADYCALNGQKLFHITTDCVFSGRDGQYTENSTHDALDDYGKTKSLGEPEKNCMIIRTSIIGEEIHKNASLIAWVKSQAGNEVNGFLNHLWNGITTRQYAKVVHQILENNLYQEGLYHVFSPNSVNKKELIHAISNQFNLKVKVNPVDAATHCDRTLATVKDLCGKLTIPTIQQQLADL